MIELYTTDDAVLVERGWKSNYYADESSTKPTRCCLLKNFNKSVIVKNVRRELLEEELELYLSKIYNSPKVKRFRTRNGTVLTTLKIDFKTVAEQQKCVQTGILFEGESFHTELFQPRKRVIQCYRCWKYGHIA